MSSTLLRSQISNIDRNNVDLDLVVVHTCGTVDAVLVVVKDKRTMKAGGSVPHPSTFNLVVVTNFKSSVLVMEQIVYFDAILFPSDGRSPSLIQLMTSPMAVGHHAAHISPTRMPHPEVHMDYIAEGLGHRAWKYQLVEALDGMNRKFANPYVIFYPVISRDGMPFPVNKVIRDIQGENFVEEVTWRGNIVVAKYRDNPFTSMIDASMADFPIVKNYLLTHGCPGM
ncbi:hypothetical protein E1B28_010196 [Marasmius oreades]|uniref:Uncharacterized protein n=1 Tax=Marasmius oreades TaxID=181124 RepID=A0A9P7UQW5_9AGAR|nr:uncharacterized protein E1B28_010196 [Marasmius oreades]KAG7091142.1 hypothetical protein E1B28_010196 [Marasmius oreades]